MKNIMVSMDEELLEELKKTGNASHTIREAVKEYLHGEKDAETAADLRKKEKQDSIRQIYRFVELGIMKQEIQMMQHPLTIECMQEYIEQREKDNDILCERNHEDKV